MEARLGYNRVRIRDTSISANVPDNDVARLMYYLKCVFTVLECNSYSQYTDYNNYGNLLLLNSGISELIRLAKKFNPNIMMDTKVFPLLMN